MCFLPMLIGNAVGGRTGAIIGGALGGGIPGGLAASQIFGKKKKPQDQTGIASIATSSFGGG
jgi:hypothetical protein